MPRMSNVEVPSIRMAEQVEQPGATAAGDYPGIPTGDVRVFMSASDHALYRVDSDGVAHRITFDMASGEGDGAPGAATHYLRLSLDGGTTWYRIALSPDA